MSIDASSSSPEKTTTAYWSRRRKIAFSLIQLSWTAYLLGAGAFAAVYALGNLFNNVNREVNLLTGISMMLILYAIGTMLLVALLLATFALIFSRKALYLGIPYVPTGIYAYYLLTA